MHESPTLHYACKKVYYLKEDADLVSVFSIVRYILLINACVMHTYKGLDDFLMTRLSMALSMSFAVL